MTASLIVKELREHWLPLLLIAGIMGLGFLLILAGVMLDDSGSRLEAVRRFLVALLPLGVLVLCNRLVVREYQAKTQLFLEALPVSRGRMISVKYLLGLTLVFSAVAIVLAVSILVSLRQETLTARFLGIVSARGCVFAWCLYSFFFLMGLMGRYRVALYVFGVFGIYALDVLTDLELARFGPFVLVDGQFAFERTVFPQRELLTTAAIGLVLMILTLALSLVREGTVATLLAEKMSHREKITVVAALFAFLCAVGLYEERVEKEPFDLEGGIAAECGQAAVKVSSDDGSSADSAGEGEGQGEDESEAEEEQDPSHRLAGLVAKEVAAMQESLGLTDPPPIFVTQWGELDADKFERAELENAEGVLVRANFRGEGWDDGRFLAWLLRELLISWSEERLEWEPNQWVLDGFCTYWTCRDGALAPCDRNRLELRAAYGARLGLSARDTAEWFRYRERVGDEIAAAVAWRGLMAFRNRHGDEAFRSFLREALDCSIPPDVRGTVHGWLHPLPRLVKRHGGLDYSDFVDRWMEDLAGLERKHRDRLEGIPRISGEIQVESISEYSRVVRFRFASRPAPESGRFTLLYAELPAFAAAAEACDIRRQDGLYPDQCQGELPETFDRGAKLYSTFATWVDALGCNIVSGWTRREMD